MGFFDWLFGKKRSETASPPPRFNLEELRRRLKLTAQDLAGLRPEYRNFTIPKRSGGVRTICAPQPALKKVQRRILRRVLGRLAVHPAARGFECGHSIVTNALPHVGKAMVLKLDLKDFFTSTTAARVEAYFRCIGWDAESAGVLCQLCTYKGSLPQGAPTSPRLSNLVNYKLDARLAGLAAAHKCAYTRYADDITFSGAPDPGGEGPRANSMIYSAKRFLADEGYKLHLRQKLQIRRQHQRQQVTGLVVNAKPALPRTTRRWLRAVEHHIATNRPASLAPHQLQGWRSLIHMIEQQSVPTDDAGAPPGAK